MLDKLALFFGVTKVLESDIHLVHLPDFLIDREILPSDAFDQLLAIVEKHGFGSEYASSPSSVTPFIRAYSAVQNNEAFSSKEEEARYKKFVDEVKGSGLHVLDIVAEVRRLQRFVIPQLQREEKEAKAAAIELEVRLTELDKVLSKDLRAEVLRSHHVPSDTAPGAELQAVNALLGPLLDAVNADASPLRRCDLTFYFQEDQGRLPVISTLSDFATACDRVGEALTCLRAANATTTSGRVEFTNASGGASSLDRSEAAAALASLEEAYTVCKTSLPLWRLLRLRDGDQWSRFLKSLEEAERDRADKRNARSRLAAAVEAHNAKGLAVTDAIGVLTERTLGHWRDELDVALKSLVRGARIIKVVL